MSEKNWCLVGGRELRRKEVGEREEATLERETEREVVLFEMETTTSKHN